MRRRVYLAIRPLWLVAYATPLVGLIALFGRFERASANAESSECSKRRAIPGAVLVCGGLAVVSAGGLGAVGATVTGVRLWALALPLVGGALTKFGPLASLGQARMRLWANSD